MKPTADALSELSRFCEPASLELSKEDYRLFVCDCLVRFGDNRFYGKTKKLEQIFQRSRRAEPVHANFSSLQSHIMLPAKSRGHCHRNPGGHCRRQNALLVSGILAVENLPRRNAHHSSLNAFNL